MARNNEPARKGRKPKVQFPRPKSKVSKRLNVDRCGIPETGAHIDDNDAARVRPWHKSSQPTEVGPPLWAIETRKRLAHIPILSIEELRALPAPQDKEGGVYFLWRADKLVYVGRSSNVNWRVEWYRSKAKYARVSYYQLHLEFDRVTCLVFDLPPESFHLVLRDYEHAYIATYLPEYNSDYATAGNWN